MQRFYIDFFMKCESDFGYWVNADEAQAEIDRLQAEVARLHADAMFWRNEADERCKERATAWNDAIEAAAKALDAWGDIYGDNAATTIRALRKETP